MVSRPSTANVVAGSLTQGNQEYRDLQVVPSLQHSSPAFPIR